jgi:hypothetical protein
LRHIAGQRERLSITTAGAISRRESVIKQKTIQAPEGARMVFGG